jgi:hypothetical protein
MPHTDVRHVLNALLSQARLFIDQLNEIERIEREGVHAMRLDDAAMVSAVKGTWPHCNRIAELFILAGPPPVAINLTAQKKTPPARRRRGRNDPGTIHQAHGA